MKILHQIMKNDDNNKHPIGFVANQNDSLVFPNMEKLFSIYN